MAGYEGLQWQTVQWSFAGGLQTKTHPHAIEAPQLTIAKNLEFDELGAVRLRHPYESIGLDVYPSGSITGADLRKIVGLGDELLAFTKDALYARSSTLSKWVLRGTHHAIKVEEATRFSNASDQVFADRAQLSGVIVYVWTEVQGGAVTRCQLAARDATTGATLIDPTSFGSGPDRPRVVAVDTKILVFWLEAGGVMVKAIDPAAPAFTATGATTVTAKDGYYDVVRDPSADRAIVVARNAAGTEYDIVRVTAALALTSSTKVRDSEGGMAISVSPNGYAHVVRQVNTGTYDILGDMILVSSLADVNIDTAIGTAATTAVNHITCAHRSTTDGGAYRCYVFWSVDESTGVGIAPDFVLKSNWIDTLNAVGSQGVFLYRQGIAARAFNHDGRIYLWSVFAGSSGVGTGTIVGIAAPYQNGYFLHRDDGELVSKAAWLNAGGFGYYGRAGSVIGHLPGVALVSGTTGYAWCGVERQLVTTLATVGRTYGARAPRDVVFTFDSDDARRVVQCGRTAYVSGGLLLQYDGEGLTEVGFCQFPWHVASVAAGGGGGTVAAGTYNHKATVRWENARGESERSTAATGVQVTLAGVDQFTLAFNYLHVTRKQGSRRKAAFEFWRQVKDAPVSAPYYLVTSKDPAITAVDNAYVENDPTAAAMVGGVDDNFADAVLLTKEQHPENGGGLPRFAPPGATILVASDSRVFLAGIPGEPTRVVYSLLRNEGEVAGFNSLLGFDLPAATGPITALALWQETLVVFTATAVYAVTGDGFSNSLVNPGSNYRVPAVPLSSDLGALSHDTVVLTPGGIVFFSRKGWYRLNGAWALEYIGAPVEDYNTDTWVGAQVVESQHQVRLLSTSRMLMWDYAAPSPDGLGRWAEWTQASGRGLAMWRGLAMLVDTAVRKESTSFSAVDYDFDVELLVRWDGLLGFACCKRFQVLGQFKADHAQRVRVAFDHQASYVDERSIILTGLTVGDPTRLQHGPSRKRSMAMRVRVTVTASNGTTPAFDAVTLTGIAFEIGFEQAGLYPRLAAAYK